MDSEFSRMEHDIIQMHNSGRTFEQIQFWYKELTWDEFAKIIKEHANGNTQEA